PSAPASAGGPAWPRGDAGGTGPPAEGCAARERAMDSGLGGSGGESALKDHRESPSAAGEEPSEGRGRSGAAGSRGASPGRSSRPSPSSMRANSASTSRGSGDGSRSVLI